MADATHQAALNVQVLDSLVTDYLALRTESPSLVRPTLRGDRLHGRVRSTVDDRLRQERTGNDLCLRYCELIKALLSGDGPGVSKAALDTLSAIPSLDTSALHDPRLQFALRQQEFTELLRKGGPDCELAALREWPLNPVMQAPHGHHASLPTMCSKAECAYDPQVA